MTYFDDDLPPPHGVPASAPGQEQAACATLTLNKSIFYLKIVKHFSVCREKMIIAWCCVVGFFLVWFALFGYRYTGYNGFAITRVGPNMPQAPI